MSCVIELNSKLTTKITQCTYKNQWTSAANSFRTLDGNCSFNIDYTAGIDTATFAVIAENAPAAEAETSIPCLLIKSDGVTFIPHVIIIGTSGIIKNGKACSFKDRIIAHGSYKPKL